MLLVLLSPAPGRAQALSSQASTDLVSWTLKLTPETVSGGGRLVGRLIARIEPGWHLYSATNPVQQIATRVTVEDNPSLASWKIYQPKPIVQFDPNFQADSELYEGETVFLIEATIAEDAAVGNRQVTANIRYGACNDNICLPPKRKSAVAPLAIAKQAAGQAPSIPDDYKDVTPGLEELAAAATPSAEGTAAAASAPSTQTFGTRPGEEGLLQFAGVAFVLGILAIFTPCVFPMIPITMSYFISTQGDSQRASFSQAATFCLGVVALFTGLGAAVSAVVGPFGIVQLGASVWVNLFIALVFMIFAASLLGAFEITVPSGLLTRLNQTSGRGGLAGTLVMGLVFALASFACTGPFVGTLLAGSIQGDLSWPIFGMAMFSVGLALPFFFLALFPAYLKRMPRSGGWLAHTKLTMGFLILAAAVKYLSNVDQMYQWWILTRERFLAIWIVLLVLASLYLLGLLRLGDQAPDEGKQPIGLGRLTAGGVFLMVAVSLIPGMFNARLGELDAYVPSTTYSGLSGGLAASASRGESGWLKNDYDGALAQARQSGKRVLVSFTGYACTNCHWMKANMFTKPEIASVVDNLIVVELYTDGLDEASEANQQLQLNQFRTVAIPYYAIVRPDGSVAAEFPGRTRDTDAFRDFLSFGA